MSRFYLILWAFLFSAFTLQGQQGDESTVKKWGNEVKDALDSARLKDRLKNTKQGVLIYSLEGKAKRQENRGELEEATLSYLRVAEHYREAADSLGVARTYNKIASLYARRGNPQTARKYFQLAALASGEKPSPKLSGLDTEGGAGGSKETEDAQPKSENKIPDSGLIPAPKRESSASSQPPSTPAVSTENRASGGFTRLQSQLEAMRDSSELLKLLIEDQEKNILILQQEKELAEERQLRQLRFQWTLIAGALGALLLASLLYRMFRIRRKALLQTQAALGQLAEAHEQLKATQTQLVESEKMASLGLLTAGIAHEINNPINFISGNIEPLKQDIADIFESFGKQQDSLSAKEKADFSYLKEEVEELLSGIEEGAERTSQIVKGLRDFSRLDAADLQQFDIHSGIESTLSLLRNELQERKVEVEKSFARLPEIEGYPGKINQVLMNVLSNAIQAMPEGGTVGIITALDEETQQLQLTILDNGKGIPKEILGKVFDPFFTTKAVGEGTGLGLAISKGIVDQHHGRITIKSEVNVGTEVQLTLPLKQPEDTP